MSAERPIIIRGTLPTRDQLLPEVQELLTDYVLRSEFLDISNTNPAARSLGNLAVSSAWNALTAPPFHYENYGIEIDTRCLMHGHLRADCKCSPLKTWDGAEHFESGKRKELWAVGVSSLKRALPVFRTYTRRTTGNEWKPGDGPKFVADGNALQPFLSPKSLAVLEYAANALNPQEIQTD